MKAKRYTRTEKHTKRKEKRNRRYMPTAAAPHTFPTPVASSAAALCRLNSFRQELPNFNSHREVHHRLIAFFCGQQLRDLHVSAWAHCPAHHLSHRFLDCFLRVSGQAAMAEEMLLRLGRCHCTPPAFIVLLVAEPF